VELYCAMYIFRIVGDHLICFIKMFKGIQIIKPFDTVCRLLQLYLEQDSIEMQKTGMNIYKT
jgi:hypothetical protein